MNRAPGASETSRAAVLHLNSTDFREGGYACEGVQRCLETPGACDYNIIYSDSFAREEDPNRTCLQGRVRRKAACSDNVERFRGASHGSHTGKGRLSEVRGVIMPPTTVAVAVTSPSICM